MLRTNGDTDAATLARFGDDLRHSVFKFDGAEGTLLNAFAEPDTSERALLRAFSETGDGRAVHHSAIFVLIFLFGKKSILKIRKKYLKINKKLAIAIHNPLINSE